MKTTVLALASVLTLGLAACNSPADEAAETQADALEAQADAAPTEMQEQVLEEKADAVEQQAGNVDGGLTTENTPADGQVDDVPAQ